MRAITGELFNTSFGAVLVYNEQSERLAVGDHIIFDNSEHVITAIIPPSKPGEKWALVLD